MQPSPDSTNKFDMSLRLWSDSFALKPLATELKTQINVLHIKGEPMAQSRSSAGRIAKRHYISLAHEITNSGADVIPWLVRTSGLVQAHPALPGWLFNGKVEATFWIAIFGRDEVLDPEIDADIMASMRDLSVTILIENYTIPSDDMPVKTWYRSGASSL